MKKKETVKSDLPGKPSIKFVLKPGKFSSVSTGPASAGTTTSGSYGIWGNFKDGAESMSFEISLPPGTVNYTLNVEGSTLDLLIECITGTIEERDDIAPGEIDGSFTVPTVKDTFTTVELTFTRHSVDIDTVFYFNCSY